MASHPRVVLVNGFGTTPRSLTEMVDHFETEGYPCAIPSVGGIRGVWQTNRVARAGTALSRYLNTLPDGVRPWLVGHSIGGMIARCAVQLEDVSDRVSGMITIGSPHQGTPAAVAGILLGFGLISRAPLDITPLSGLIRRLNKAPWPNDVPLVSVVSHSDILCPIQSGTPQIGTSAAVRTVALSGVGHTEMVRAPWVLNVLLDLMNDPHTVINPAG